MEATRKEWGNPTSKVQVFTPQEFVAACDYSNEIPIPAGKGGGYWKIDGYNKATGSCKTSTLDGYYNASEQVTSISKLNKSIIEAWIKNPQNYHIDEAWGAAENAWSVQPGTADGKGSAYATPPFADHGAILHKTGSDLQIYYLSDTYKGDSIDDYMSIIKNNS